MNWIKKTLRFGEKVKKLLKKRPTKEEIESSDWTSCCKGPILKKELEGTHKLIEFVLSLPDKHLLNGGWTKFILRHSQKDILPKEITWRKDKIGYTPPQQSWENTL